MAEAKVPYLKLTKFIETLFIKAGYTKAHAKIMAESLVETSLRGVDSHGVRLTPHYVNAVAIGRINNKPKFKFKKTGAGTGLLDASNAHGIIAGLEAMKKAMALAKKTGIAAVGVKNSTHFAAAAIYSLYAAENDMIGISFTHANSLVAPYGGKKPFLGTNPICFAAPCANDEPFCLDMSTAAVTRNKVLFYKENGKQLEQNWAVDSHGEITTDPSKVMALFPYGGYKGYGLGLMIEILCSLLTGMPFGPFVTPMIPLNDKKRKLGHFFIAIDIRRFETLKTFKKRLKEMVDILRSDEPARGTKQILVPGDPEIISRDQRMAQGIPIGEDLLGKFNALADKYQIEKL